MNYFSFIILCFYINLTDGVTQENRRFLGSHYAKIEHQTSSKSEAFAVLRDKCNVCHASKKRTDIFTLKNMDSLAQAIDEQVFIKKKMPKGRKVKLTEEELSALKKWLTITL